MIARQHGKSSVVTSTGCPPGEKVPGAGEDAEAGAEEAVATGGDQQVAVGTPLVEIAA